jgi:hypothetical protein
MEVSMTSLVALWLPILASAIAVFIASSLIHMLPGWHRNDYPQVPGEEGVMDALRPFAIPPGDYLVPRAANTREMQTPEFIEKLNRGPVLVMTVLPNGPFSMGRSLLLWFVYTLVVGVFAAYAAGRVLHAGADPVRICQLTAVTAFAAYTLALWQMSIWYWRGWGLTLKATLDGVIYAVITSLVFCWLWPTA